MKSFKIFYLPLFFLVLFSAGAFAQEHYTEGNVRVVSFYRTKPGQFDNYMKYLRTHFLPVQEEAKKPGRSKESGFATRRGEERIPKVEKIRQIRVWL